MNKKKLKFALHLALQLLVLKSAYAADIFTLDEVTVSASANDLIGLASTSSEGTVTAKQLENRPLLRPAEVMEVVPGLIVSQHSGDGKANQYYLRGFNLDHGTDFSTFLMDMPVNLPSHAHGQGYTDLNFLIPELVDRIQYRKGTYYAGDGDFSAAGSARIDYVRKLEAPFAQATVGNNNNTRLLAAASPAYGDGNLLLAGESYRNDGPWLVPEDLHKSNLVTRYSQGRRDDGWSVSLLGYDATWTATDQIAQRAIDTVGRYGSLDPSTGGNTHRNSLSADFASSNSNGYSRINAYYIDYALELWSNFTYATDPVHGDQFLQTDKRSILGGSAAQTWQGNVNDKQLETTIGTDLRNDDARNGLFLTQQRNVWGKVREDKIRQTSVSLWGESKVQWLEKFRTTVGLRADSYQFDVASDTPANSGTKNDAIVSPKLALVFGPWNQTEYYINAGYGFHSNDARGTVTTVNPDPRPGTRPACTDPTIGACSGDALSPVKPLVRAEGYEIGLRTSWIPGLQSTLTLWQLNIDSELIFIGDAGTTNPSRPSKRQGLEWANYWNPADWLLVDADLSLSSSRYRDSDPAGSYIPGSIEQAASIAVTVQESQAWSGGIRLRYFGPRPMIEDNSVRSESSTLVNLQIGYKVNKQVRASIDILNLLDTRISDIDYYYASQLAGEAAPVNDIHTHPAEPRTLRLSLRVSF
jgi:outer membrane cobalamin receptor